MNADERLFLVNAAKENDFIKMLVHDWTGDPMFIGKAERVRQINEAQQYCLELLFRGQPSTEVMRIFICKSGIAYELRQSLGL